MSCLMMHMAILLDWVSWCTSGGIQVHAGLAL